MYACLAVTCHLHFWQNDRDFLRATVVTRGWNGYRNKSQHRKSTLEKKILPPFQQGFKPSTFQSRVRCSNHWAIPAPFLFVLFVCNLSYLCYHFVTGVLNYHIKQWHYPPHLPPTHTHTHTHSKSHPLHPSSLPHPPSLERVFFWLQNKLSSHSIKQNTEVDIIYWL